MTPERVLIFILIFSTLVLIPASLWDSVTVDEPDHLMAGLNAWTTGDLTAGCEHPPLIRMWAAFPVLLLNPETTPLSPHAPMQDLYHAGVRTLFQSNNPATAMVLMGRSMIWVLVCCSAWVLFRWAQDLFGPKGALLATLVFLFNPGVLAHGRLITTDMGAGFTYLIATRSLAHVVRKRTSKGLMIAALCMAAAICSKFSTFPILLVAPVALYLGRKEQGKVGRSFCVHSLFHCLRDLCFLSLGVFFFVWLFYGFQFGKVAPILDPFFQQIKVGFERVEGKLPSFVGPAVRRGIESIPVPFPGLFAGLITLGSLKRGAYLLGAFSDSGWWYYLPFTILVKTPIPLLVLMIAGLIQAVRGLSEYPRRNEILVLIWALAVYWFVSCLSGWSIGYRHLLPVIPLHSLLVGFLLAPKKSGNDRLHLLRKRDFLVWGCLLLALPSLAVTFPRYLSYFNVLVGGPKNGYRYLIDSNLDWGQDVVRLKRFLDREEIHEAYGEVFCPDSLEYYGVSLKIPRSSQEARAFLEKGGVCIVSANVLVGLTPEWKTRWGFLREFRPTQRVGDSLFVFGGPP